MNWDTYDRLLFALCLWREAAGEGEAGMRAAGHVILNRMKAWKQSLATVITKPAQFSSMTIRGDLQTVRWPNRLDQAFPIAMALVDELLTSPGEDPTNGATFYRNPKTATSEWYERNIARNPAYRVSAVIDNHEFHALISPPIV